MPTTPARRPARWSGLDGLRALAVLAVLGFHFAPGEAPGGFLGVDVFFVLSGYLITRMIAGEYLRTGRFRFGDFYRRRARRLLPGLGVVLVAVLAAAAFWRDQLTTVRAATGAAAGYFSNWYLAFVHQSYFVSAGRPSMLQHLWSLGVEEQFYLFWPLLAVGLLAQVTRWRGSRIAQARWLAGVAALLAVGSLAEMALLAIAADAPVGADASRLYYGTDTHSMGLLLGAAVGALAAGRAAAADDADAPPRGRLVPLTDLLAAGALAALFAVVLRVDEFDPRLYRGGFFAVAAVTAAVVAAVTRPGSVAGRWLDRPLLRWLAARSYAMYLWHWPVAVVTRPGVDVHWPAPVLLLLRVGVTVVLADVTYRMVELPIRTLGVRSSIRRGVRRLSRIVVGQAPVGARLVTAALVTCLLVAAGVLAAGPRATLSAGQKALAASPGGRDLHLGTTHRSGGGPAALEGPRPQSDNQAIRDVAAHTTPSARPPSPSPGRRSSPPSAKQRTAHALPAISAFGDSVMLGARDPLDRTFPSGTLDAVEGRQPDPILQDVESDAAAHRLNPLVVIGVGDNGLITPAVLRQTLGRLAGVRQVIVINNRVDRPWQGPNNRTIAAAVPHYRNVRLLDWHRLSAQHGAWFYDDGIHLTPGGATAYTRLITRLARAS